jgi:hypothetical protein
VAAYLVVGGLPGVLYAAGICLAAFVGALAIHTGRTEAVSGPKPETAAPRPPRWRRKKHIIAELEVELAGTVKELEEHRHALANLAAQLTRESEAAQRNAEGLEQRIRELESERDGLQELVSGSSTRSTSSEAASGATRRSSPSSSGSSRRSLRASAGSSEGGIGGGVSGADPDGRTNRERRCCSES